jgi:Predicted membrane protein (DUF2207)
MPSFGYAAMVRVLASARMLALSSPMNEQVLWYTLGPLVLLVYYLFAVRFVQKKRPGAIVTQYKPPAGLSPAMMRYVFSGQLDEKAVAATVVRLAALGLVRFHGLDRYYSVVRTNAPLPDDLAADEIALYRFMFNFGDAEPKPFPGRLRTYEELPHGAYLLAPPDDPSFATLLRTLRSALLPVGDTEYFTDNLRYILPAASLSFALSLTRQDPAVALLIGATFACCLFLVRHPEQLFGLPVTSASDGFYNIRLFFLFMFIATLLPLSNGSVLAVVSLTAVLVLNFCFIPQLRDRTPRGYQLLSQLQGYRQFLQSVELDRMQRLKAPEFAPNAATDYLVSAIALDIEHAWGDYVDEGRRDSNSRPLP